METAQTGSSTFYGDAFTTSVKLTATPQNVTSPSSEKFFTQIPQTIKPYKKSDNESGSYIALLVKITQIQDGKTTQIYPFGDSTDKYAYAMVPLKDATWTPGKKYVYNINFFSAKENGTGGGAAS